MNIVYQILVALHIVGVIAIAYGFFSQISKEKKEINPGLLHGSYLQLVTGIAMVGLAESGQVDEDLNMTKISIKLAVVLALVVAANLGKRAKGDAKNYWLAAGALWLVNVVVAVAL